MKDITSIYTIEEVLDNSTNVAEIITDEDLKIIGSIVCEEFEADDDSREEWEEKNSTAMEMALQVTEEKSTPWQGAANIKYPLLTTAALQFSSRAYPALIQGNNIVRGRVVGFDEDGTKAERATRIGKHMSYQLIEEMEDWEEEMDKLCLALPIVGCIFKKTYFDPLKGLNTSELIYPEDVVINYWSPTLEKADRITHVLRMSENDIHSMQKSGAYLDDVTLGSKTTDEDSQANINRGITEPNEDSSTPYSILEQHRHLDLDGDGYKEPYIVTIEEESKQVLRIIPRFTVDSIITNGDNEVVRIEPIHYFTKFGFIPSPDGSIYDLGFGQLLGPMNDTVNTLINQLLDAGSMANMQAGFISKGIRVKGGDKKFQLGEWKQVNTTGEDLRKGIYPLPVRDPSNVLFQLLGMITDAAERMTSVTEMMTGEIPGQNTKATVAMAAIEQGMKVFNAIYKRMYRSLKKEFKKLYRLNKEHLSLEQYFTVLDVNEETAQTISVIDYKLDSSDVIPYADPTISTEAQRLAKIEALGQLLQLGTINPQEYTKRYLEATEQPNIAKLMQMGDPKPDLEMLKFKDESARAWKQLEIDSQLAGSKISKEEIDGIVSVVTAKVAEGKLLVDQVQAENAIEKGKEDNVKRSNEGLEEPANNE